MKVVCFREELLSGLSLALSAVTPEARAARPALSRVLITAEDGGISLYATDLEVSIIATGIAGEVHKPGRALLPASAAAILKESRASTVSLEATETAITLTLAQGPDNPDTFSLPAEDCATFPEMPAATATSFVAKAANLGAALKRTLFACADESMRYAMNGVRIEVYSGAVRLIGSDGRRLSVCDLEATECVEAKPISVPRKALGLLDRMLSLAGSEDVAVSLDATMAHFSVGHWVLSSRLLEGLFPDYRSVMPTKTGAEVTLDHTRLVSAVRLTAAVSTKEDRGVVLEVKGGVLTLRARTERGESLVTMPADNGDGLEASTRLDADFLVDFLKTAQEPVRLSLPVRNKATLALFRCGTGHEYLVMPLTA